MCSKCADISHQVFYIKDRTPGVNFPPLHPWCRCTFEIYVEDWDKWQDDYVKRHSKNPDKILQSFRQNANIINDGNVTVLMKTKKSRLKDYEKFLKKSLEQFSATHDIDVSKDFELLNKFCDSLLKKGVKYGFKYIKY